MALTIPLTIAALAAPVQIIVGDWAARDVSETQPIKLAAIEGLYRTTRGAPEHLLGWYSGNQLNGAIAIPHLLAILTDHSWNGAVQGLETVPAAERPPVNVVHWAFQLMVGIGTLLALVGVVYLGCWLWRRRLPESKWFYRGVVLAGPLAVVALIAGWVVTEVGRQPWVVYRVMSTAAAVTGAHGIPVGYAILAASYVVVAGGLLWVLRRLARAPLASPALQPQGV
jgi:cytochrome d ubiquinol oxidase subunit I